MVDVTEISAVVAAAGVLIGVVYYALEMREQTTIRKTSLMVTLYRWVQSDEYQDAVKEVWNAQFADYEDYVKKYGSWTSEAPIHRALTRVLAPMDMVGTMLYRKQIDIRFAYDLWGSRIIDMLYEKVKPIILGLCRQYVGETLYVGFFYLRDELKKNETQLKKTWGKYISLSGSNNGEETPDVKKREQKLQQRGVKSG